MSSSCCGPGSGSGSGRAQAADHVTAAPVGERTAHGLAVTPDTRTASSTSTGTPSTPYPTRPWCAIEAGPFTMGNDGADAVPGDGEGPTRRVTLEAFRIAATTVTNREFAEFVRATRYITDAEVAGQSFVFYLQVPQKARERVRQVVRGLPWWLPLEHTSWQRPEGPGSHVHERLDHPVVHVSWNDAMAYCAWAGTRLATEAEWECAARGGLEGRRFAWGDDLYDDAGVLRCNVFRGDFPNAPAAGWLPQPVAAHAGVPNGHGLYNVCGNVWEWCADLSPNEQRALRGGSFLCHDSYCNRYRVAARTSNTADTAASNIGFRVAINQDSSVSKT